jgi:Carboxypeptidase regulatory-like domain
MNTPIRLIVVSVLLLSICPAPPLRAQSDRASLRGVVLDPAGQRMPGLSLTLANLNTGENRTTETGEDGTFALSSLPPGEYNLDIREPGYRTSRTRTSLEVGQELWLEVPLELGNVTEEVLVTAASTPVDRESAALATVIDGRQIVDLPLDGRNFLELSLLAPGTAQAPEGSASSQRGDFAFTVNGGREDAQSFVLDGVYNIDPKLNTPAVRPPVDAIREFEVRTGTYDASLGRNAAGQVNVITRSGTNQLHGTAYGFLRLDSLGARNFFAPAGEPRPDFSRGQYGVSVGGPIAENRTFFFADYEHTRRREGITRLANVPSLAERAGDFSGLCQSGFDAGGVCTDPDPTHQLWDVYMDAPLPYNQIPGGSPFPGYPPYVNPIGQAIVNLYPEPNRTSPTANFVSSPLETDDVDHFDARIDQSFGDGATLTGRYSFSDRRLFEPFASAVSVPGYGTDVPRRGQNLMVGLMQPLGTSLVHDARVAWTRVSIGVFQENRGQSLNQMVGLPEISSNDRDFGLSQVTAVGYTPLGDEFTSPQESTTDSWQVLDNLSWAHGPHLVRIGFDARHVSQDAYRDVQSRGFLNFSGFDQTGGRYISGNALANLLMGYPLITGGAVLDNPQSLREWSWSGFAQDSWRIAPDVTLSAGLRYEYVGPAFDAADRANLYDPASGQLVPVGTGGMPRGGFEPDRNNWAPRVGVAWTPDASGRTVIRGGYGVYYNQGALATGEGVYFNAPYFDLNFYSPLPPDYPTPGDPAYALTLYDPFPANYRLAFPVSATAYQRDLQTGRLEHWSVSVQRQLGDARMAEVAYVASRGHHLIAARDINQPDPSPSPFNLRPNPMFDDITLIESRGRSEYDALQIKYQQRLEGGLSLLSAYTLGKSEDDASGFFASSGDPNFPQDSRNPEEEFARSSFDVRHRFSTSLAWALPLGPNQRWMNDGVLSTIFSEMEIQSVVSLESGPPFTVALLPEIDNSNTGRSTLGFGANDRPDLVGDPMPANPTPEMWFDTTAFGMPAFGTFGDVGRNTLEGPGYRNFNLGVLKHVALGEAADFQLRFESFNLFNRANFNLPDGFLGSPTFGQITSARNPRRCQFGLKLIF